MGIFYKSCYYVSVSGTDFSGLAASEEDGIFFCFATVEPDESFEFQ